MNDFKFNVNRNIIPVVNPKTGSKPLDKPTTGKAEGFEKVLEKVITKNVELKFSKHAQERLEKRKIEFTSQDLKNISSAVDKAAEKGLRDTLIILGNTALIANIKSKTVITAATEESLRDKVFTNIDGAIII